jgi:hypothetical protein
MLIGHYAVALASKKAAPKTSLGTLFLSAQFIDLLWPAFLLIGLEHVRIEPGNTAFTPYDFYDYPISHSLLTVIGWSLGVGFTYYALRRYRRGAWIIAAGVLSHWVLDFIAHRPDMPLVPGVNIFVGLGLWNSVAATVILEGALFAVGLLLYVRSTEAIDRTGRYAFWSFILLALFLYAGAIVNPQPPTVQATAIGGLLQWLIIPWTYWIDRHRKFKEVKN